MGSQRLLGLAVASVVLARLLVAPLGMPGVYSALASRETTSCLGDHRAHSTPGVSGSTARSPGERSDVAMGFVT